MSHSSHPVACVSEVLSGAAAVALACPSVGLAVLGEREERRRGHSSTLGRTSLKFMWRDCEQCAMESHRALLSGVLHRLSGCDVSADEAIVLPNVGLGYGSVQDACTFQ